MADQDDQQQVVLFHHRREAGKGGADLIARRDVDVVADRALRLALGRHVAEKRGCDPAASSSSRAAPSASSSRQAPCWVACSALPAAPVMMIA